MDSWTEFTKDRTPEKICAALPESGVGSSRGISALERTNLMFEYGSPPFTYRRLVLFFSAVQSGCSLGKGGMLW